MHEVPRLLAIGQDEVREGREGRLAVDQHGEGEEAELDDAVLLAACRLGRAIELAAPDDAALELALGLLLMEDGAGAFVGGNL